MNTEKTIRKRKKAFGDEKLKQFNNILVYINILEKLINVAKSKYWSHRYVT